MTALQVLKELKKERWPELKTGEYNLPLIIAAMHKFAELRQCNVSRPLPHCNHQYEEMEHTCGQIANVCRLCGNVG